MCILINYDIHMLNKNAYQHTYHAQHIFDIVTVSISNMYVLIHVSNLTKKPGLHVCISYLVFLI